MKRLGEIVFAAAFAVALALYGLTVPDELPWNTSTHLALAYLGEIVRLPAMPHPFWGFYVQVFGGSVALSVFMAALAAGLLGSLSCRYLGWRFAASAALVWVFLPGVWNRAITGERGICLAAMVVVAAWVLNGVALRVLKKARAARKTAPTVAGGGVVGADESKKRGKINRIAGWVSLGAAGMFAVVSLTLHDYRYGEAASVFARGVVDASGERVIVLNGVCDDQVVREVEKSGGDGQRNLATIRTLSLRNDDAYRTNLLAWAKAAFPTETNLWIAAQVSPQAFVDAATKRFPDRFYLMNGKSTTLEQWEKRWEAFKPLLGSSDPFVRTARRMFGYEGNAVANAMLEEAGDSGATSSAAWRLYKRIYTEIDTGNFSALVNMIEMIRRGYAASGDEKKNVQEKLETFFKNATNRKYMREIARAAGPVRADPALMEKMAEEAKKRVAAKIAAGEEVDVDPEILSLIEWNNEMCQLMDRNELVKAGRIARAILSNPKWRGFIPANAVMGSVAASEDDYVASERFFQVATDTTNTVATVVLNNYADTLMHLGKLDEAEKVARRAIKESDETFWLARLTLAEVLEKKEKKAKVRGEGEGEGGNQAEIRVLIKSVLKYAPEQARDRIRKEHKGFIR